MKRLLILKVSVLFFIFTALFAISGCSYSRYPTGDISSNPTITRLDSNSMPFYTVRLEYKDKKIEEKIGPGTKNKIFSDFVKEITANSDININFNDIKGTNFYYSGIGDIELPDNKTFSIKYHHSLVRRAPHVHIPVGFSNGNQYPAYLDTGFYGYILLTSDIILDNKLPIFQLTNLCHISELTFGDAKIKDALVNYDQEQWQFRVLNIPVYKQTDIIIGREFIRYFDYVVFDNVRKEAIFSKEDAFTPDNSDLWTSYLFYEDPNQDNTIMLKIPIAGQALDIAFDSCAWKPGLHLNQNDWELISKDLTVKNLRNTHHYMWQTGQVSCQKAIVSELSLGDKTIKNAEILIYDNKENLNLLSLDYFQDTVVVLDFVNNLFWIKK